jgi:hypothetical protein
MQYSTFAFSAIFMAFTVTALPSAQSSDTPLVSIQVGVVINSDAVEVATLVMFDAVSDSIGISSAQGSESAFARIDQPGITCTFTTARIANDAGGRIACDLDTAIATISEGQGT